MTAVALGKTNWYTANRVFKFHHLDKLGNCPLTNGVVTNSAPAAGAVLARWQHGPNDRASLPAFHRAFLDLEATHGMFELTCDGVPLWEYVRAYVHLEIQRALGLADIEPFHTGSSWGRRLRRLGGALAGLIAHHPYWTTRKPLFFFGCPRRIRTDHGTWCDTAVDPFLEAIDLPYYYIERLNGDQHHTPTRTKNVHYFDWFNLVSGLRRLAFPPAAIDHDSRVALRAFQFALADAFGVEIDVISLADRIWQARCTLVRPICRLLDKVRPRLAFFASINYPERVVLEVCKRKGIPTIELQHGVIASNDPCYSFPLGTSPLLLPDFLFVWGDYWRENIHFPPGADRVVTIGHPYLEERIAQASEAPSREQVVFLSQPTIGDRLFDFACRLARRSGYTYDIVFRLHPSEQPDKYRHIGAPGIRVSTAADRDLVSLLAESKAQIGVHSAALFEGLALGLPTYLLPLPGAEEMRPLVDRGWCRIVESAEDIPSKLPARAFHNTDHLFAKDAKRRFNQIVTQLLGRSAMLTPPE